MDGECTLSPFVEQWPAEDAQECLEICREYQGDCNYFTYYGENGDDLCVGFRDCVELSSSGCDECYTGNVNCPGNQGRF